MAPTPVHRRFIRRSQHVHGRPNPDYRGERGEYVYRDAGEREECSGRRYRREETFGFDFGFDEFFFFVVFVFPVGRLFSTKKTKMKKKMPVGCSFRSLSRAFVLYYL